MIGLVDVGQDRATAFGADIGEYRQRVVETDAPGARPAGPVGFVIRGLVNEPDAKFPGQFDEGAGHVERMLTALQGTRAGDQHKG